MLHNGSVGRFQSKECFYTFKYTFFFLFWLVVVVVVVFQQNIYVFIIFIFFFDEVSNLRNIIFNQSETGIVDKKSVSDTVYAK